MEGKGDVHTKSSNQQYSSLMVSVQCFPDGATQQNPCLITLQADLLLSNEMHPIAFCRFLNEGSSEGVVITDTVVLYLKSP